MEPGEAEHARPEPAATVSSGQSRTIAPAGQGGPVQYLLDLSASPAT
jgi:hypothetical protein